jgi:hypothetical protein
VFSSPKVLAAWTAIGVVLTVLPEFNGGGFLALVIWPVYLLGGATVTVVSLVEARRADGRRVTRIAAAWAPAAISVGWLFIGANLTGTTNELLFRVLFETRRRRYEHIIATVPRGTAAVRFDRFRRPQVDYFVESTTPFRAVFPLQVYWAGWQAVVYDPSESLNNVGNVPNNFNVPKDVPPLFARGYFDKCKLIASPFYRCWLWIPE